MRTLAISTFYYISGAIFGPLVLFVGLGYLVDNTLKTKPIAMIIGLFVAFVSTNILIFKKVAEFNKIMASYSKKVSEQDEESSK